MKLLVIYGPPAVGKLTVARELSKLIGLEVFHNHLTVDFLDSFYESSRGFFPLLKKIRMDVFEAYTKNDKKGLIFTFVYSKPHDDDFVKDMKSLVVENGGEALFVRLFCDEESLFNRVTNESRKEFGKIKTSDGLKKDMAQDDIFSAIDFVENLEIDNTNISAQEAAEKIVQHFGLNDTTGGPLRPPVNRSRGSTQRCSPTFRIKKII